MSNSCPVTDDANTNDLLLDWEDKTGIDLRHSSVMRDRPDPVSTKAWSSVPASAIWMNGVGGVDLRLTVSEWTIIGDEAGIWSPMTASTRFPDVVRKSPCEMGRTVNIVWVILTNFGNGGVAMGSCVCGNWKFCTVGLVSVNEHNGFCVHIQNQAGGLV